MTVRFSFIPIPYGKLRNNPPATEYLSVNVHPLIYGRLQSFVLEIFERLYPNLQKLVSYFLRMVAMWFRKLLIAF